MFDAVVVADAADVAVAVVADVADAAGEVEKMKTFAEQQDDDRSLS